MATADRHRNPQALDDIRRFNRCYTRQLGWLDEGQLKSEFTLTELRLLYELAHRKACTATDLARDLALDAGYLSRLLKKFESAGLLARKASNVDARQSLLGLTAAGRRAFEPLNRAARDQVAAMVAHLGPGELQDLIDAMRTIERLLDPTAQPAVPYLLRPHQVGDIGWVAHRQGLLYAQEYGWDETFEALVAEIAAGFVKKFDPKSERCWIAEREGHIVGSVFLVRKSARIAQLRLLYVEPAARGLGIGARLTDECIRFSRAKGYKTMVLWTNSVLVSARRIYEAAGFKLVGEEPHESFGKGLVGQTWRLAL